MENWKYTAFISYRHGGTDEYVAKTLHAMLESYKVPSKLAQKLGKNKVGRIFRDVDELPSSSSLYNNIEEALEQSEYLIVVCTPRLKESKWCMREIELFKKVRGSEYIIAVLAEGEPQDSFPYEITHHLEDGVEIEIEPLAADVRGDTPSLQKKKMKVEKLRMLAAMLHCEFDQLRQREKQRRRQRRLAVTGVSTAVICAFLAQTMRENIRLQKQVRKTQSAQSYLLAEYSDTAFSADDPKLAAMLAMEGLPQDLGNSRPFEGAAMASLTNALQTYSYQKGYKARGNVQTQTMDSLVVSPYGDYIAYIDLVSSEDYTLHFYNIEKNKVVADFPVDPDYCSFQSCNSKMAFFGDHRCAIAGKKGIQIIDMKTMKVIWEGAKGMTVSVSRDDSVISIFDTEEEKITFYTADGKMLSERSLNCEDAVYYGMNENGMYAGVTELSEEGEVKDFHIIDTHTGKTVKLLKDKKFKNIVFRDTSWCKERLLFSIDEYYGYLDMKDGKVHMTNCKIGAQIFHMDGEKQLVWYGDGNELKCISMITGEVKNIYESTKNIADAVYTGDSKNDMFAIYCEDGSIEYVDYNEKPYRIGQLQGDGTSCSEVRTGGKYLAAYLMNNFEFRIYELNDKKSDKKSTMKKLPHETIASVVRAGNLLCINGSQNTYNILMDTLEHSQFDAMVSYMEAVNEQVVSCDNLDGTISFYDAKTGELLVDLPDGVWANEEVNGAFLVDDGVLKQYSYDKTDKSVEEVEPVHTEKISKDCESAFISQKNYVVGINSNDQDENGTLFILDPDRKEIFTKKVTDYRSVAERDYVLYQEEGSKEYIIYNYVEDKEIAKIDLGEFSWLEYLDGGYVFLCSSNKGAFILNDTTGEVVLEIPEANTLYTFDAPKRQPYFTALYLSDNGETRLDIYDKNELSSPVAKIKGGLGMNDKGEVLLYDGVETVYDVPFLSMKDMYENGKKFLGDQTLTPQQKIQYHCE